jgi:hypothetical protein
LSHESHNLVLWLARETRQPSQAGGLLNHLVSRSLIESGIAYRQ